MDKTHKMMAELFTKSCKHKMKDTHLGVKFLGDIYSVIRFLDL